MRNGIFRDSEQWREFREIERGAEQEAAFAENCEDHGRAVKHALLSLGKRVEALTYVIARAE